MTVRGQNTDQVRVGGLICQIPATMMPEVTGSGCAGGARPMAWRAPPFKFSLPPVTAPLDLPLLALFCLVSPDVLRFAARAIEDLQ